MTSIKFNAVILLGLALAACGSNRGFSAKSTAARTSGGETVARTPAAEGLNAQDSVAYFALEAQGLEQEVGQIQKLDPSQLAVPDVDVDAIRAQVDQAIADCKAKIAEALVAIDQAIAGLDPNDPDQAKLIAQLGDIKTRLMDLQVNLDSIDVGALLQNMN